MPAIFRPETTFQSLPTTLLPGVSGSRAPAEPVTTDVETVFQAATEHGVVTVTVTMPAAADTDAAVVAVRRALNTVLENLDVIRRHVK